MYRRNIEGYKCKFLVLEINQLLYNRRIIQIIYPVGLLFLRFAWVGIILVIVPKICRAQNAIYTLTTQATEIMIVSPIIIGINRLAAVETLNFNFCDFLLHAKSPC